MSEKNLLVFNNKAKLPIVTTNDHRYIIQVHVCHKIVIPFVNLYSNSSVRQRMRQQFLAHQIEFSAFFTHFNKAYLLSYFLPIGSVRVNTNRAVNTDGQLQIPIKRKP